MRWGSERHSKLLGGECLSARAPPPPAPHGVKEPTDHCRSPIGAGAGTGTAQECCYAGGGVGPPTMTRSVSAFLLLASLVVGCRLGYEDISVLECAARGCGGDVRTDASTAASGGPELGDGGGTPESDATDTGSGGDGDGDSAPAEPMADAAPAISDSPCMPPAQCDVSCDGNGCTGTIVCLSGDVCVYDCRMADCSGVVLECDNGATCDIRCADSNCGTIACNPGSICSADCSNGECSGTVRCAHEETCDYDCSGGGCADLVIKCPTNASCNFDCEGGDCGAAECESGSSCAFKCAGGDGCLNIACDSAACSCETGNQQECASICGGTAAAPCSN